MKYRKKQVVVEAIQWNGENEQELKEFVGDDLIIELIREPQITENGVIPKCVKIQIKTLEGIMLASLNDYIIKGINEEFYPCKPDVFEKTYEDNLETSNVEKVFEMLGVKPNEEFEIHYVDGDVRLRKIDESLVFFYKSTTDNQWYSDDEDTLRALLNGQYKVTKPLLTNEEKGFLKNFGFDSLKKVEGRAIMFTIQALGGAGYALGLNALRLKFNGLEFDKEYTKEELGL